MRPSVLVVLATIGFLTGCSPASPPQAPVAPSTPPIISQAPTMMQSSEAAVESSFCSEDVYGARLLLAVRAWARVVRGYGRGTESEYTETFAEYTSRLRDNLDEWDCSGDAVVKSAELAVEASLLNLQVLTGSDEVDQYDKIVGIGEDLIDILGAEDRKFIPIDCAGTVDDTAACTEAII